MIRDSSTRDGFTGTVSRDFRPKFFCLKHSTVSVYYTVFAKRKTVFACSHGAYVLIYFTMKRGRNCLYTLLILTILNGKNDQKYTAFAAGLEIRAWFFVRMSSFLKKKSGSLFALFALKKEQ